MGAMTGRLILCARRRDKKVAGGKREARRHRNACEKMYDPGRVAENVLAPLPGRYAKKLRKGERHEVVGAESETFQREPTGRNPVQQRVVPGWKRVLRGNGATRYVKCTQRVNRPRD